ncbi:MAG: S8 family serine peptidase [Anaerolineae bacterium]|nr:S8 family serine peptidase [Anaerolineae bacterium]
MKKKSMLVLLLGGGVILLGTAIALFFFLRPNVLLPQISLSEVPDLTDLTPLPSLTELAEKYPQIAPLLNDAQLDAVYKEFLVAYQTGGREAAAALAQERGLFTPDGLNLRVTLVLDTEDNTALTEELRAAGIDVVSAYRDRVNVSVPLALIEEQFLSQEAGEDTASVFQQLTQLEHVIAVRLPETRKPESLNPQGDILGEGVSLVGADAWHAAGFTGAGLRIGVLDLGFAGYEALLGTELPANVTLQTFGWYDAAEVHGAACAEIIHEVAPEATLFFAWYDGSDAALGEAVEWLRTQQVNIISHSVGAVVSPRDGTGWGTHLVDETAAEGILWVNSAGNEALTHHRGIFADEDGDGYHEFSVGDEVLPVYSLDEVEVYLVWEDDWQRPVQDLELVIVDDQGTVLATSEEPQDGTLGQRPAEVAWVRTDGDTVYAAVQAFNVTQPVTLDIFVHGSNAEVGQSSSAYSVSSPGDAANALTVGATNWWNDRLASYSSQGPTTDGRLKPDMSAPAGVSGATYGESGFDGTSASTPHVAGAAALVWEANPGFTREQVKDYLLVNALDFGPTGPDTGFGHGRLQLPAAVPGLVLPPTPTAEAVSDPVATTPLPPTATATAVAFVTLEIPEESPLEEGSSNAGTVLWGLFIGGLGCTGAGFLLAAVVIVVRSGRTPAQRAMPYQPLRPSYPPPASPGAARPGPASPAMPPRTPPVRPAPQPLPPASLELPATERVGSVPKPPEGPQPPSAVKPVATPVCPVCGARARPGARFCAACGSPLDFKAPVHYCRRCGAELRPNSRFCSRCGEPVINREE